MTTQEFYQKVLKQEATKEAFLWEVRRDQRFSHVVTNTMSYEDIVSTLKGKGFISETNDNTAVKPMDFLGNFKRLQEGKTQKLKGGKGDKLTPDQVNYHEFTKGWKHEMEHTDDIDKAKEIALDHLAEDPMYYTRLEMIEYKADKKNRTDLPIDISKKKADMKDPNNQMKPHTKKKEAPNVKETLGKQEKATSKTAGLKKMKGEGLPMKSIKEAEEAGAASKYMGGTIPTEYNPNVEYLWKNISYKYDDKGGKPELRRDDKNVNTGSLTKKEFEDYKKIAENKNITAIDDLGKLLRSDRVLLMRKSDFDIYQDKKLKTPTKVAPTVKGPGGETKSYEVEIGNNKSTYFFTDKQAEDRMANPSKYGIKSITPLSKPGEGGIKKASTGEIKPKYSTRSSSETLPDKKFYSKYPGSPGGTVVRTGGLQLTPIKDYENNRWFVVDNNNNRVDDKSYPTREKAKEVAKPGEKTIIGMQLKAIEQKRLAEAGMASKFQSVIDTVRDMFSSQSSEVNSLKGKGISLTLSPKGVADNPNNQWDIVGTISSVKYNESKNDLIVGFKGPDNIKMGDPGKKGSLHIYLKKDGQPDMTYFEQTIDNQRGTPYKVLDLSSKELQDILNAKYPAKEQNSDSVLEAYIRKRIVKAIREGEEGQYIGVVGPDVKKKKLEDYMKRYNWGYQNSSDPAVKSIGGEYNGIVSKLIFELGPDGLKVYNTYAPDEYKISDVSQLGGYTANANSGLPNDGIYNPEKLMGRGGRMAEGEFSDINMKSSMSRIEDLSKQSYIKDYLDIKLIQDAMKYFDKQMRKGKITKIPDSVIKANMKIKKP